MFVGHFVEMKAFMIPMQFVLLQLEMFSPIFSSKEHRKKIAPSWHNVLHEAKYKWQGK